MCFSLSLVTNAQYRRGRQRQYLYSWNMVLIPQQLTRNKEQVVWTFWSHIIVTLYLYFSLLSTALDIARNARGSTQAVHILEKAVA